MAILRRKRNNNWKNFVSFSNKIHYISYLAITISHNRVKILEEMKRGIEKWQNLKSKKD